MNVSTTPILAAIFVQLGLAVVVFLSNRKRHPNQAFLFLSFGILVWLGSFYCAFRTKIPGVAEFAIREASVAAIMVLVAFNLLRLAIRESRAGWGELIKLSRVPLVFATGMVIFCQTNLFITGVEMNEAT